MKSKITILYERLSRDDENQGDSFSIVNQKKLLEEYAEQHGFQNCVHFTDDGISGTRFDRPGFVAMTQLITEGNADILLVKDMSRLGRDYLKVGQYMELLRQKNVRLIAVNDGTDTLNGDDEFAPFRNIMNEFYARDISKKIRSTFKTKGMSGKHVASSVPYGYLRDAEDHNHWIVDEEAAEVVRRIFRMIIEGYGSYQIANTLKAEKIEIPAVHLKKYGEGLNKNKTFKDPYNWSSSTVSHILDKYEYLGHTVNFKTRKHFKDKKSHYVDPSQWIVFENTQEPIIDQETYDLVQSIRRKFKKRYPNGWGEPHILSGLMYCADCGSKLYIHRETANNNIPYYACSGYAKTPIGSRCPTLHRIRERDMMTILKDVFKALFAYAKVDREGLVKMLEEENRDKADDREKQSRSRLAEIERRTNELDLLVCRIYEDHVLGKISDNIYNTLSAQYTGERETITKEKEELERCLQEMEKDKSQPAKFMKLVDKYMDCEELSNSMIMEFIDKIYVHERSEKFVQNAYQEVDIYFNFVGQFLPPNFESSLPKPKKLTEAEERKREKRNIIARRGYQRNKEKLARKRYAKKEAKLQEMEKQGILQLEKHLPLQQPEFRKAANG